MNNEPHTSRFSAFDQTPSLDQPGHDSSILRVLGGGLVLVVALLVSTASQAADVTPDCGGLGQTKCEFGPAVGHGKAKNVGCPSGSFFDPRMGGECWTCPRGFHRTLAPVTAANACATGLFGKTIAATFKQSVWGCGGGQFFDPIDGGSCWSCPQYFNRSVHHVKSAQACTIWAQYTCDEGFQLQGNTCAYGKEKEIEGKARAKLKDLAEVIVATARLAATVSNDPAIRDELAGKSSGATGRVEGAEGYGDATQKAKLLFNTLSIGLVVSGNVAIAGASAETGVAIDFKGSRPVYWYGGASYKFGPGASADGGINIGFWLDENDSILGNVEGYVLGMNDLMAAYKVAGGLAKLNEALAFKKGGSLAVGLWFDYEGNFKGFTVTPTVGVGIDFGGYARATTAQGK